MDKDELEIEFEKAEIIIRGECKTLKSKQQYYLKERPNRKFEKRVTIPSPVKEGRFAYFLKNGILTITFPYDEKSDC